MMPGIPGGRQLAASVSSGALSRYAFLFVSYSGVGEGTDGAAVTPRAPPPPRSHTPEKSGSFASAAQSAGAGAFVATFWAPATELIAAETITAATIPIIRFLWGVMRRN